MRLVFALAIWAIATLPRAEAQELFRDDFETSVTTPFGYIGLWDGPPDPSTVYLTDRIAHSGRRSVELKYAPGTRGASYMYYLFHGQDHVYFRWYQRWSTGFVWEPSATKMAIVRPLGGYPQFYPEVLWGNGQLAIQAQVVAEANWDSKNFYQNVGEPVVFGSDRWYGIEVFVKLNTPGAADGALAAWIDGELKLAYTGRQFRGSGLLDPAPSSARLQAVALTGYYGGVSTVPQEQYSWQDDAVVSLQPIGFEFLSDGFEDAGGGAAPRWDGPANPTVMYSSDGQSHWNARALELRYEPGSSGASYMYKPFQPQDRVFVRWFQRWSNGFAWEPSGTGLIGLLPDRGYPHFYPLIYGEGRFAIQAQVLADRLWQTENFFQNRGSPVAFAPERWYCIEVGVTLNTPGSSDGSLTAWIDGEQALSYAGREFRGSTPDAPAPSTARLQALLVSGQYGGLGTVPQLQFAWMDDYVASTERVGCAPRAPIH